MKKDNSVRFKQSTQFPWIELRVARHCSACYEAHTHDEFSFGLIDQGTAHYRNRNHLHHIHPGQIVTINPTDVHACNPHSDLWSYRMIFINTLQMGEMQRQIFNRMSMDYRPFDSDFTTNPKLRNHFPALFSALQAKENSLEAESHLFDFIENCFIQQSSSELPAISSANLAIIRDQLLDDITHIHPLSQLAQQVNMSSYQLLRAFKKQFGLPPHAYVMDEKIKRAKSLLKSGNSVAEIALDLGFSDQAHFQRQFKRKLAVTPKFYQSQFLS
ncbi:helix-turn-helix domain-containing protein [Celerinatantimonas sp. YJH-8]|uniref:helix-turn-helix domain-containing protein n=1 Tax=Celerinatantimonas sp. YJH-8 TaxID=3228714 RepID=UPI0038C52BCE